MAEDECKENYIELLDSYRNNRCLWDPSHSLYTNRDSRCHAYNNLLQIYRKIKANANIRDLKRKLENMRTTYNRELKKVRESIVNGGGASGIYIPKLWYFENLSFLNENEIINQDEKVTDDFISEDNEYETGVSSASKPVAPPCYYESTQPSRKKPRISTFPNVEEQLIEMASALVNSNKQDEWEMMGLSLGMQLRDLDPEQQAIAQKLMSDVLYYAKIKKLTHSSRVELMPCPQPFQIYPQPCSTSSSSNNYCPPAPSPAEKKDH